MKANSYRKAIFGALKSFRMKTSSKCRGFDIGSGFKHVVFHDRVRSLGFDGIYSNGVDYFEIVDRGGVLTITPIEKPYFRNGELIKVKKHV